MIEKKESGQWPLGWAMGRFSAVCGEVALEGEFRRVRAVFWNMEGAGIYWEGWASALRQLLDGEGLAALRGGGAETSGVAVLDGMPPGPVARVDVELFPDRGRFVETVVVGLRGLWPEWSGHLEVLLRSGLALIHGYNALTEDRASWLWITDLPEVLADEGVGRGVAAWVAAELGDPDLAGWLEYWRVWDRRGEEDLGTLRDCLWSSGRGERGLVSFRLHGPLGGGPLRGVGLMRRGASARPVATVEVELEASASM